MTANRKPLSHLRKDGKPRALKKGGEPRKAPKHRIRRSLPDALIVCDWRICARCEGLAEIPDPDRVAQGANAPCQVRRDLCYGNFFGRMHPRQHAAYPERIPYGASIGRSDLDTVPHAYHPRVPDGLCQRCDKSKMDAMHTAYHPDGPDAPHLYVGRPFEAFSVSVGALDRADAILEDPVAPAGMPAELRGVAVMEDHAPRHCLLCKKPPDDSIHV